MRAQDNLKKINGDFAVIKSFIQHEKKNLS
jgi:hypothetical protein